MVSDLPQPSPPPQSPARAPRLSAHERLLVWRVPGGWTALSSASVGGGLVRPGWVLNAQVDKGFSRTDLDAWATGIAARHDLAGPGCALLTAADVEQVRTGRCEAVTAWATVGVTRPTWAVPSGEVGRSLPPSGHPSPLPGTINIVVSVPAPLTASALVQAVGTVTEAKAQVLVQAGVPGTGTSSDAVVVLCPEGRTDAVPFAGVRSSWGQRVARAVHDAVADGLAAHPWPVVDVDPQVVW